MTTPGISILDGKYMITMDLYPQENEQFNQVYPFFEYLREGRFTTTKCKDCGAEPFPPRIMCPECTSMNMEWIDWPTEGTVVGVTEEEVGVPPGFGKGPLIHALVDLQGKRNFFVRILNCQSGQLKEGDKVKLTVFDIEPVPMDVKGGVQEVPRVYFGFEPV